ncbi:winged helix-turn-helix domain-containing protein [Shewanella sp. GXUN23E]|uniref:winged helix-turn-helix domain-containing protein n=1 Tax=Shewanella sp. GXUN23E TaxID=3422498 RepID=UPI003D7E0F09
MEKTTKISNFNLGTCRVDLSDNSLSFDGQEKLSLQPKFIEVLAQLARGYPEVVTRDELIETVWDGNEYVGSKALTNAIWHLRQHLTALGDDTVIDTVRKTGYRLLIAPQFDEPLVSDVEQVEVSFRQYRRRSLSALLLVALVSVAMSYLLWTSTGIQTGKEISYLTREDGSERFPAVSPNGRYLVYGGARHGSNYGLFLKEISVEGALPKRLSPRDSEEARAVWHPGGEYLYYPSRRAEDRRCFFTEMQMSSGQVRYLTPCNSHRSALDISPDGSQLAYIHNVPGDSDDEVYLIRVESNEPIPEKIQCQKGCSGVARDLAFSPDGRYLAIARRLSNITEDIFLYDLNTGEERALTQGMEDIRGLTWHHSGKQLVFGVETSGVRRGFSLDLDSGKVTDLAVPGFSYPKFIPGSQDLVYNHYARQYDIAYMDVDKSIPQTPYPLFYSGYGQRLPDYSAAAGRVVYTSNETGFNEIWTSDSQGNNRIQHTFIERRALYPRWSADGHKIAFIAPDELNEGNQIYVLQLDNGEMSVVASPYSNHTRLFWGPGDKAIYSSIDNQLVKFPLDGAKPVVLRGLSMSRGQIVDESLLVFSRPDAPGLWQLDIEAYEVALTKSEALPTAIPLIRGRGGKIDWQSAPAGVYLADGLNWVAGSQGVYFKQRASGAEYMVSFWDRQTNQTRGILRIPNNYLSSFGTLAFIPSEQRLLMTLTDYPQRDIMRLSHPLLQR